MVANVLRHTVADRLELLESVPTAQAARLYNAALVAGAPITVERYSKSLPEWRHFAETCGGHWDCPPVGLVLSFADWLKESWRLARHQASKSYCMVWWAW